MIGYSVKSIKNLSAKHQHQLLELFAEVEFAEYTSDTEWLADAIANSVAAVGAFDDQDNLIGFARALGDNVSDCYLQDVAVNKSYRSQGVGKALVKELLALLKEKNIDWVGLVATPGKAEFYRKLGFEVMTGYTPMHLQQKNLEKYD